jgi:hypothetical protein
MMLKSCISCTIAWIRRETTMTSWRRIGSCASVIHVENKKSAFVTSSFAPSAIRYLIAVRFARQVGAWKVCKNLCAKKKLPRLTQTP